LRPQRRDQPADLRPPGGGRVAHHPGAVFRPQRAVDPGTMVPAPAAGASGPEHGPAGGLRAVAREGEGAGYRSGCCGRGMAPIVARKEQGLEGEKWRPGVCPAVSAPLGTDLVWASIHHSTFLILKDQETPQVAEDESPPLLAQVAGTDHLG